MIRDEEIPDLPRPSIPYREMKVTPYPLDEEGIGRFYLDSYAALVRRFMGREFDPEQVKEAAQDVYFALFQKRHGLNQQSVGFALGAPLFGWVSQALGWRLTNLNRDNSKLIKASSYLDDFAAADSFEKDADRRMLVQDALMILPPREATALRVRYFEDQTLEDTAASLDLTPRQAEYPIYNGLKHMREILTLGAVKTRGRPKKKPNVD